MKNSNGGLTGETAGEAPVNGETSDDAVRPATSILNRASRAETIAFTASMLEDLAKCTRRHDLEMLTYYIEMAVLEAKELQTKDR